MQVWSIEGRCLDSFDGVADQVPACIRSCWLNAWHACIARPAEAALFTEVEQAPA